MNNRFLPIGSVVLLKNGKKGVMITGYCVFPKEKVFNNGEEVTKVTKLFEYGGCTYPEGIIDSNTAVAFNHNQIQTILHLGYETPAQEELSKKIDEQYDSIKKEVENN